MDIYMTMMTFLITTTVSKMEVLQGWAQARNNPSSLMGYLADRYRMDNAAPTMMVMTTTILTNIMDYCWAAFIAPRQE